MIPLLLLLACSPDDPDAGGGDPGDDTASDTSGDTSGDTGGDSDDSGDSGADSGDSGADSGDTGAPSVEPPFDATSGGSGGADAPTGTSVTVGDVTYRLLAPTGSARGSALPLLVVISGTEGADAMMSNMRQVTRYAQLDDALVVVLDGRQAEVPDVEAALDDVRADFDVDNDRTWLLSESAGTTTGLGVALRARQSWFAAFWANDVNDRAEPTRTADQLGFDPWGNAGPGGNDADAEAIVDAMRAAGYRLPADAPYSGPGADQHGSTEQFLEAVSFFHDKERN